jgi:hypothetical protein
MSVGRLCVRDVDTANPDESVAAAAERMHQRAVGRSPRPTFPIAAAAKSAASTSPGHGRGISDLGDPEFTG